MRSTKQKTLPSALVRCLLVGACALPSVACGGSSDALKKEVNQLRDQVTQLQGSQDHLEERLMAMEAQRQVQVSEAREAAEPEVDERPRLKVVRLLPEEAAPPGGGSLDASEDSAPLAGHTDPKRATSKD